MSTSLMTISLFLLAAMVGTVARYAVFLWLAKRAQTSFPYGTLCVNLVGSLLVGAVVGKFGTNGMTVESILVLLGAFTTFSTFNSDVLRMLQNRQLRIATIYTIISYIGSLTLTAIGYYSV